MTIYTLKEIHDILFQGFDYSMPEQTLKRITELNRQVAGSAAEAVRVPVFHKKVLIPSGVRPFVKSNSSPSLEASASASATPIAVPVKTSLEVLRGYINKLTDKNYATFSVKIQEELVKICDTPWMEPAGSLVFEIASTNRFYSKIYADLVTKLLDSPRLAGFFQEALERNRSAFLSLFDSIETVDPKVDYDRFCEGNKASERRKSLAAFYRNLPFSTADLLESLVSRLEDTLETDGKKAEVDELTECIVLLYDATTVPPPSNIKERIRRVSMYDIKEYKSLTKKSIFKLGDLV
jgi:hypothetical protein